MPQADSRGTAPERTRLSWRRTSLLATVVTLLAVRLALIEGGRISGAAIAMGALCWVVLLIVAQYRVRALTGPQPLRDTRLPLLTAMACVAIALIGVVLVLQ